LAGRSDGHVGEGKCIHNRAVLDRKDGQLLDQVALLGLEPRTRVVGDQTSQPLLALGAQEPGTVDGVEAEPVQRRSLAHVIQERGRDQQVGILGGQDRGRPRALSATAWTWVHRSPKAPINRSAGAVAHDSRVMGRRYLRA
jgi:hypothetical protein